MASYMSNILGTMQPVGVAASYGFAQPARAVQKSQEKETPKEMPGSELLTPGTILYASNDLTVSSTSSGAPVRATVVHGPLKGAVAVGTFQQSGERLIVTFRSITHAGVTKNINGYGVDPVKAESAVASSVNNNTLLKVGMLLAASFLEGWGEALRDVGTTRRYNYYEQVTVRDRLNPSDQAQMAAGKLGGRAANYLEKKIDEPPVVTLYAGTSLGILIVN